MASLHSEQDYVSPQENKSPILTPSNHLSTELYVGSMLPRPTSFLSASTLCFNHSTAFPIIYIGSQVNLLTRSTAAREPRDDQPCTRVTVSDLSLTDYWHTLNFSTYFHQMKMYLLSCVISMRMPSISPVFVQSFLLKLTCIGLLTLIDTINK